MVRSRRGGFARPPSLANKSPPSPGLARLFRLSQFQAREFFEFLYAFLATGIVLVRVSGNYEAEDFKQGESFMDEKFQQAKRQWLITQTIQDEAVFLLERLRVGDLSKEMLDLAAYCGNQAAMKVVKLPHGDSALVEILEVEYTHARKMLAQGDLPSSEFGKWILGLAHWGVYHQGIAGIESAGCCVETLSREIPQSDWLIQQYKIARTLHQLSPDEQQTTFAELDELRIGNSRKRFSLMNLLQTASLPALHAYTSISMGIPEAIAHFMFSTGKNPDYQPNLLPIWAASMATKESYVKDTIVCSLLSQTISGQA